MKYAITLALCFVMTGLSDAAPQRLKNGSDNWVSTNRSSYPGTTRPTKLGPKGYSKFDPANPYREEMDYTGRTGFERWVDETYDIKLQQLRPVSDLPTPSRSSPTKSVNNGSGTAPRPNPTRDKTPSAVKPSTMEPSGAPMKSQPLNNPNVHRPYGDKGPAIMTNPFL